MQKYIENYFSNFAVGLISVGNIESDDISKILTQQEEIIKKLV